VRGENGRSTSRRAHYRDPVVKGMISARAFSFFLLLKKKEKKKKKTERSGTPSAVDVVVVEPGVKGGDSPRMNHVVDFVQAAAERHDHRSYPTRTTTLGENYAEGKYSLVNTLGTDSRGIFSPALPARMSSREKDLPPSGCPCAGALPTLPTRTLVSH
jgi:hypothetical protein